MALYLLHGPVPAPLATRRDVTATLNGGGYKTDTYMTRKVVKYDPNMTHLPTTLPV